MDVPRGVTCRRGHRGCVVVAGGDHDVLGRPASAGGGAHLPAPCGRRDGGDLHTGEQRRVEGAHVHVEVDDLGAGHEPVGVRAGVAVVRQAREPAGAEESEEVPALAAPALRGPAAFEDDVVLPGLGQLAGQRETCLAGTDDDRADVRPSPGGPCREPTGPRRGRAAQRRVASIVTGTPSVTTSRTAERPADRSSRSRSTPSGASPLMVSAPSPARSRCGCSRRAPGSP